MAPSLLIVSYWHQRLIRGQIIEVSPQTVTLGVDVGEGPALQQLVVRELNAGNQVCRAKSRLFHLAEEVIGIAI